MLPNIIPCVGTCVGTWVGTCVGTCVGTKVEKKQILTIREIKAEIFRFACQAFVRASI